MKITLTNLFSALYSVAKSRYNKPYVILLYGNTGIGKTESAKFIANTLGETLFRKQYSILDETEKGIIDNYQIQDKVFSLVEKLNNAR